MGRARRPPRARFRLGGGNRQIGMERIDALHEMQFHFSLTQMLERFSKSTGLSHSLPRKSLTMYTIRFSSLAAVIPADRPR